MLSIWTRLKLKKHLSGKNLPACLVGLFILLSAGLAGMFAAKAFQEADLHKLMGAVCGVSLKSYFWCALGMILRQNLCLAAFAASSCYPVLLPLGFFLLICLPFQTGFLYMCASLLLSGFARAPLFLSFLILSLVSFVNWVAAMLKAFGNVKRVFLERNVPKTGRDVIRECAAFLSKCGACMAVQTACAILEAACIFLLLS